MINITNIDEDNNILMTGGWSNKETPRETQREREGSGWTNEAISK